MINAFLILALAAAIFISVLAGIRIAFISDSLSEGGSTLPQVLVEQPVGNIYQNSTYLLPVTWSVVIGLLIWKGRTRSAWARQGYDYSIFKLVTRMRGGATRTKILHSLSVPKNKHQLANEFGMDWKTIDSHVSKLHRYELIDEMTQVGTSKYFIISEKGKKVLSLISESNNDVQSSTDQ